MTLSETIQTLCDAFWVMRTRSADMTEWQNARLARIENRLAKLDGENDAEAAKQEAFTAVNDRRATNMQEPLSFAMQGKGKIVWAPGKRITE